MGKADIFKNAIIEITKRGLNQVYFASNNCNPPMLGYVVSFPRLSVTLAGENEMEIEVDGKPGMVSLRTGDAVFVPGNCWNKPTWEKSAKVISFLFGKKHTGISLVTAKGGGEENLKAEKIATQQPMSGPGLKILESIIELRKHCYNFEQFPQLIEALIGYCIHLTEEGPAKDTSKSKNLVEEICSYLQENFQYEITRDSVARQFKITPNHLSRIFKTHGNMKFSDYLKFVRIDRAKFMLSRYDMTLVEIAQRCGYNDSRYFCSTFKKTTRKTPTGYKNFIRMQMKKYSQQSNNLSKNLTEKITPAQ
ncbi:MAG TPA: AraC family transcriptional regulator [Sedimentisphaerales bacterium]|nr:AraC family transcriptional regulator [Sedimentisphaerales bacterium]